MKSINLWPNAMMIIDSTALALALQLLY